MIRYPLSVTSFFLLFMAHGLWLIAPKIAQANFTDLPLSHPAYEAIIYLQDQGILNGYPDGSIKPDHPINRAETVKILASFRASSKQEEGTCEMDFKDVPSEAWFSLSVCQAFRQDMIKGYADQTFRPAQTVNFVESAKMIHKALEIVPHASKAGAPWYQPFVDSLAERKAIPPSITSFDHPMTRAEVAEIIFRLKKKLTRKASRSSQLNLFQWPEETHTKSSPQYQPFTYEDYEQALGNRVIGLFFFSQMCPSCQKIDEMLTQKLSELPASLSLLKIPFEAESHLKALFRIEEPGTIILLDQAGNLSRTLTPKNPQEILELLKALE